MWFILSLFLRYSRCSSHLVISSSSIILSSRLPTDSFFFSSFILTHVHITYSFTHASVVLTSATLWTLKLTNCLPSVFELQQVAESRDDNGKAAVSARYVSHAERGQRSQGLTWLHLVSPFPPPIPDVCVSSALWWSGLVSLSALLDAYFSQKYSDWPEWRLKLSW